MVQAEPSKNEIPNIMNVEHFSQEDNLYDLTREVWEGDRPDLTMFPTKVWPVVELSL